jgi:hypothetical protein
MCCIRGGWHDHWEKLNCQHCSRARMPLVNGHSGSKFWYVHSLACDLASSAALLAMTDSTEVSIMGLMATIASAS